jgi:hypothetical protein
MSHVFRLSSNTSGKSPFPKGFDNGQKYISKDRLSKPDLSISSERVCD